MSMSSSFRVGDIGLRNSDEVLQEIRRGFLATRSHKLTFKAMMCRRKGLGLREVPGFGDCLFRAVSVCEYGDESKSAELRNDVIDKMKATKATFSTFLTPEDVGLRKDTKQTPYQIFDTYVAEMSERSTWGGHREVALLEEVLGKTINVYCFSDTPLKHTGRLYPDCEPLHIAYSSHKRGVDSGYSGHYNALLPVSGQRMQTMLNGCIRGFKSIEERSNAQPSERAQMRSQMRTQSIGAQRVRLNSLLRNGYISLADYYDFKNHGIRWRVCLPQNGPWDGVLMAGLKLVEGCDSPLAFRMLFEWYCIYQASTNVAVLNRYVATDEGKRIVESMKESLVGMVMFVAHTTDYRVALEWDNTYIELNRHYYKVGQYKQFLEPVRTPHLKRDANNYAFSTPDTIELTKAIMQAKVGHYPAAYDLRPHLVKSPPTCKEREVFKNVKDPLNCKPKRKMIAAPIDPESAETTTGGGGNGDDNDAKDDDAKDDAKDDVTTVEGVEQVSEGSGEQVADGRVQVPETGGVQVDNAIDLVSLSSEQLPHDSEAADAVEGEGVYVGEGDASQLVSEKQLPTVCAPIRASKRKRDDSRPNVAAQQFHGRSTDGVPAKKKRRLEEENVRRAVKSEAAEEWCKLIC